MSFPRPTPRPRPLTAVPGDRLSWRGPDRKGASVTGITLDSRSVRPGDLYAALPGATTHGIRFLDQALQNGAVAVLTDAAGAQAAAAAGLPTAVAEDPRAELGDLSAWIYGDPASRLLTIGLTGTNGKTTTSYLVEGGLSAAGHTTGIVGTTGVWIADDLLPSARTTPEAPDVHGLLAVMLERGVTAVVMEVSSHALALGRVDGITFDVALFTNLSQDHLDFHGSMEEYFATKAGLFTQRRARSGVVCIDDEWGRRLARGAGIPVATYAVVPSGTGPLAGQAPGERSADYTAWRIEPTDNARVAISVATPNGASERLVSPLPGRFNAANALGAYAALVAAGIEHATARQGLLLARAVPGRMERISAFSGSVADREPAVFVDYAHTPDAVARVITAGRELTYGRVITVLGCGGDRDRDKRPQMGRIAAQGSDEVIITDDNPRSEDPADIRAAIMAGVPENLRLRVDEIGDRHLAIASAVSRGRKGDVVLILGKGHETGQEVAGTVLPFDDRAEALAALRDAGGGHA